MEINWGNIEFNEYELMILYKLCIKPRFCRNGHYDEKSLVQGVKSDKICLMKKAIDRIYHLKIIDKYKAQLRHDYCFHRENYVYVLDVLKRYASQYDFIDEELLNLKYNRRE